MTIDWGVNVLRLSLFSSGQVSVSDKDWKVLTGQDEAEGRQAVAGGKRLNGKFAGGVLTFVGVNNRADIILSPDESITESEELMRLPTIGAWHKAREEFVRASSMWLAAAPYPFKRLAFGATLLYQTKDRDESYKTLKELLDSVEVAPDKMRDLLFRVNWPVESKIIPGLSINRLTTWSSMKFLRKLISLTGTEFSATSDADQLNAVRLEIDHSTDDARQEPFDPAELVPIYNELVGLACENADQGECP